MNNNNNLNLGTAWNGGNVPVDTDVGQWNTTYNSAGTALLGASMTWGAIQVTDARKVQIIGAGNSLTLNANSSLGAVGIDMSTSARNFTINCDLVLGNAQQWNVISGMTLTAAGSVSGGGALTLNSSGSGTIILGGAAANTYSGLTTVSAGILQLAASGAVNAIANGGLTVGSAGTTAASVQYTGASSDMMGTGAVTLNGRGQLDFNGTTDTIGDVTITGTGAGANTTAITNTAGGGVLTIGTLSITPAAGYTSGINTGTGTLTLGGTVTFTPATDGQAKISGKLDLGSATRTFNIGHATATPRDMLIDAVLSSGAGAYGITKTGAGLLSLSATNTYTGTTTVSGGILKFATGSKGATTNLIVNAGSTCLVETVINTNIADTGTVYLNSSGASYGVLYLTNTVNETVDLLFFDGTNQWIGTWGATGSGCAYTNDNFFSGAGKLTVSRGSPGLNNDGGASNVQPYSATLNGTLLSTGGVATTVIVYWGPTDGGKTNTAWAFTNNLGAKAAGFMSNTVSSLSPASPYYYTFYASNEVGEAWPAASSNFTTHGSAPVIDNDGGASNKQITSATLNGTLTSTGELATTVIVYWGTTDGGKTNTAWEFTNNLGAKAAGFISNVVSSLDPETPYFYTFYASNALGVAWPAASSNFVTQPLPASEGSWNYDGGGDWSVEGNWTNNAVAFGEDKTAYFTNAISDIVYVQNDLRRLLIGNVVFGPNACDWFLTGGTLTLTNSAASPALTVNASTATVSSVLTGLQGFTKTGTGTLTLSGTTANTVTGLATVAAGTLVLDKPSGVNAVSDNLTVSGGTVKWQAHNQVKDSATVTLSGGVLDLQTFNDTVNVLYFGTEVQLGGTWGSSASAANYKDDTHFSGSGVLTVIGDSPTVNNAGGATNLTPETAWLNGTLLTTGKAPTTVWVYWGPTDGGITNDNWTWSTNFGLWDPGALTTNVPGLSSNTLYYYRFYATNSYGGNFASETTNFTTYGVPLIHNAGGATNVLGYSACLNGTLVTTSGAPTEVWVYWGTTDGDTTNGSWGAFTNLGIQGNGALTTNITGLASNTLYYYRFFATNAYGGYWAPATTNFTTGFGPGIDNDGGASYVLGYSAWMNGTVTSTGRLPTVVYVYWGLVDKGTTNANWANTNSLGINGVGTVSTNVIGLTPSTNYFYRFFATNAAGSGWAPSTTNFSTPEAGTLGPATAEGGDTPDPTNWTFGEVSYAYCAKYVDAKTNAFNGNSQAWLILTNFGFSVPTNAIIEGIVVERTGFGKGPVSKRQYQMALTEDAANSVGTVKVANELPQDVADTVLVGGTYDLWGWAWEPWQINLPTFGVMIRDDDTLADPLIFDRIRVTVYFDRLPRVNNDGGASDIGMFTATLNGNLTSTGQWPTAVWVYWGTNDAATTNANWGHTNFFGTNDIGALATNLTGLSSNTLHYYRFCASNATATNCWADATSNFWTWGTPSLDNDGGATNVTGAGATLRGVVTKGSPPPVVTIFYGPTDGETNAASWSNSVVVGEIVGSFSNAVSAGLIANQTNYYRCYATNIMGDAWAPATSNFWVPGPLLAVDNVMADKVASGTTSLVFTVSLSLPSAVDVFADYTTSNGTAQADTEYLATNGLLCVTAGDMSATISVTAKAIPASDGLCKNFYVDLSSPTNASLGDEPGEGSLLDARTPRAFLSGSKGGIIDASSYHVVIPEPVTVNDMGYLVVYAKSITVINHAAITADGKGFGGGGGGGGVGQKTVGSQGFGGLIGYSMAGGEAGAVGANSVGGKGGDGGGTAESENWAPDNGYFGSGTKGGVGGKGGGPYGGAGGVAGGVGGNGGRGGYNYTDGTNGGNTEAEIGSFFAGVPSAYGDYAVSRGSGSGGGGGGGMAGPNGKVGGNGGAVGGLNGYQASGGGGGGAAGGGAIVLRAVSGPLDLGGAGVINACGAAGVSGGGSGAGGGVCLVGPTVFVGGDTVVTNHGGTLSTNGGTTKIWYHSAGGLTTNESTYHCGQLFVGMYGPWVDNDGGATNVTCTNAWLNGTLLATGGAPSTVYLYWGNSDGGTTPGNWSFCTNLGVLSTGLFSAIVENLVANQPYFYRAYATNSEYWHWAGSSSTFTTPPPILQFAVTNASGAEASTPVNIQLMLSVTSIVDVTVNYLVTSGTASNGVDYTLTNGTATITAGNLTANIVMDVANDSIDEWNEAVNLVLSGPVFATLGADTNTTYTITDDDAPPNAGFYGDPFSVDESGTNRTVTVALSSISGKDVTIDFATSDGSAASGVDYDGTNGTLTWVAGESSNMTFVVPITDDVVTQADHTVVLTLSNPVNCTNGVSATTIIIIDNDDTTPKVSLAGEPYTVDEGGGYAVVSAMINATNTGGPVSIVFETFVGGTAVSGEDYRATNVTLTWDTGESGVKTGLVTIVDDALDEWDESFYVRLLTNAVFTNISGNATTTVTIVDNDLPPAVSFTNLSYTVAENGITQTVSVVLTAPSGKDLTVNYATSDGTAESGAAHRDYTNKSGTLTWLAGFYGTTNFTVSITNDTLAEYDETIVLTLSGASNVTVSGSNPVTITLVDDDVSPTAAFSTNAPYTVDEGSTNAVVTLTLSGLCGRPVWVDYATSQGTATNGLDYSNVTGTVTWNTYETNSKTFLVPIIDNLVFQSNRTVIVTVSSNAVNGVPISGSTTTTITIVDNDLLVLGNYNGAWQITATNATLRGEIIEAMGELPYVRFYWGPSDGKDNIFNWAYSEEVGIRGTGIFSAGITGLVENQTYYYRAFATRSGVDTWAAASENFVALDPPSVTLLDNGGMETSGPTAQDAKNWMRGGGVLPVRISAFPRTGSYSMQYPVKEHIRVYGADSNDFTVSWNGQWTSGQAHDRGGVRPGNVLSGKAYVRSGAAGKNAAQFTYVWSNLTDNTAWMATTLSLTNTSYQVISISKTNAVSTNDVNNRFRPELQRKSGNTGNAVEFYGDDLEISASLPRLSLSSNPANIVTFPDTKVLWTNDLSLGARNQGGGNGTILYGAYITNAVDLTNGAWSQTAWAEYSDPGEAYSIVAGAALVATNSAGYQYCTLRFVPPDEGTFTGIVRIATTDPSNHYANSGILHSSIVYYAYTLVGKGIKPPTVTNDGGATNIQGTTATLRGEVLKTGGQDPLVRIYWGRTDGGTSAASWSHTNELGVRGLGAFSADVAGLKPNRWHYYRVYATNVAGDAWANSTTNFKTPPVPPVLDNGSGATNIGMTEATLIGNLISCGGTTAAVRIYWGVADGMTNATDWTRTNAMGNFEEANEGLFSLRLTGLFSGTTYWYRCYATNSIGGTWAIPSTNFATLWESDGDGMPDVWEGAYPPLESNNAADATMDFDGDGVLNIDEYTCGTIPTDSNSYLRVLAIDLTNANDVGFNLWFGTNRIYTIYAGNVSTTKTAFIELPAQLAATNLWTDTNAVTASAHRYYQIGVIFDGRGYTNTEEWAMHRQDRPAREKFLMCVPVNYGAANENNLKGKLGQHIARGLYASGNTNLADTIRYRSGNDWKECYLATNVQGGTYWWDPDTATTANVPVTAGMALWVYRGSNTASRTNAVFVGRSFTAATVTNLTFVTNRYTMFGWPLGVARRHVNTESIAKYSTPSNQLGFETLGIGGTSVDPKYTNRWGDQIWVWKNNTWKDYYWLCATNMGTNYGGKWWDSGKGTFADFALEPGMAYYYRHPTNQWGGTNFVWKPAAP